MRDKESSQAAELNADHGDIDPSFRTGFRGFVIADQSALPHQPAEGTLNNPTAWQDFETRGVIGAFDDLDCQFGAQPLDPLGERLAGIAAIHPQDAEPGEPAQHLSQNQLRPGAFGGAGRGHDHAEHQPQRVHQQMPLAAFDPFGGVLAHTAALTVGLHALTIQNGRRGPAALAADFSDEGAQRVLEDRPLVIERPLPENMVNSFPRRKVGGQISSRAATLDDIKDGIQDAPTVGGRASAFGGFWEHRFEVSPLGIRETGFIYGIFHAPTEAPLKIGRQTPSWMSTHPSLFFHSLSNRPLESQRRSENPIIQTGTKAPCRIPMP